MKTLISVFVVCMACSGCATERFRVSVTDNDGLPVSNAVVSLGFSAGSVAWLEFDAGCGAYFGKQTGCKEFPSAYCANTNAVFRNRLPFMFVKKNSDDKRIDWRDIATGDEYMVLRTRVKLDFDGNVI